LLVSSAFFTASSQTYGSFPLNVKTLQVQNGTVSQTRVGGAAASVSSTTVTPAAQINGTADKTVYLKVQSAMEGWINGTFYITVNPDVQYPMEGWVEVDPDTCDFVSEGSWQVTTPPQHGTVATAIIDNIVGFGYCVGYFYPINYISYTWTSTDPSAVFDTFSATWSLSSGQPYYSNTWNFELICPIPTIYSITPNTWIVGQTYIVTIAGSNFTPSGSATPACPVNTVAISTPSGAAVAVSNVSVVSATQITATVSPPANETTETATVTVSGSPAATTTAQIEGCFIPTAETTAFQGWDTADSLPTVGIWQQTVSDANGDTISGYLVQETNAAPAVDTCWFPNQDGVLPITGVTGSQWTVNDGNTWGPDDVGVFPGLVTYYRAHRRAPCGATVFQQMQIQCPDNSWYNYGNVNTLEGTFTSSSVTSVRAGGTASRRY
jgi:hypothetical protein